MLPYEQKPDRLVVTADIPKKIAESTGRLPPTPILHIAAREHNVIEFGEAPAERAKTPVIKSVTLKDNLWVTIKVHQFQEIKDSQGSS
jgi:hypothetical protein